MDKKSKNILIVEDDKLTRAQIKNGLKEKGYKVSAVSTAREAIDYCIKTVCDMVLLDLGLPDNDGIYVIQTRDFLSSTLDK